MLSRLCCLLCLASACATTQGSPNELASRNASVVGVIALQSPDAAEKCEGLTVIVKDGTGQVGAAVVRTSRQRCSYQIDALPSDVELTLDIRTPDAWSCDSGSQLTFEPAAKPITLKEREMRTQDFRVRCTPKGT